MEKLNEETLEQVTETSEAIEETEIQEEAIEASDDVNAETEPEAEDEVVTEPAELVDKNRDALRKFVDLHQLLSIYHQRSTQPEYRDRARILGLLNLKSGIETKDMTQILGLRKSDLNTALDKLEAEGLIERVWGDEEKRWATISLTEEGRAAKIPSGRITDFAFDGFTDEELDTFIASLECITKNVEAELGEDAQKLLKEQRASKPTGKPEDARGRGGRDDRDDRGRGGFHKHDDRGGRGGFGKRDDRGGRGGFGKRDDRGGRGGFGKRDEHGERGGFDRDRGPRRDERGSFGRDNSKRGFGSDRGGRGGFGSRGGHGGDR